MYVLYVHYSGYCLFKVKEFEEIGHLIQSVRSSMNDIKKFMSIIKLKAFYGFHNVNEANDNIISIKENNIPFSMIKFVDKFNFKRNQSLGFEFLNLSGQFKERFGLNIINHVGVFEILRSIKLHISKILKNHRDIKIERKFLKSLSHKIVEKMNVGSSSGVNITNNYNLITDMEKNLAVKITNLKATIKPFFPELLNLVDIKDKLLPQFFSIYFNENGANVDIINNILGDELAKVFNDSINNTIGKEISSSNKLLIKDLSDDILRFYSDIDVFKKTTCKITKNIAPTLSTLLTLSLTSDSNLTEIENNIELSASKLIASAGSLKKLSELPSTTIHTLTFKDSLLRKGKFNNIPRSEEDKIRSKQSKLLSNKAALASRIDYFSKNSDTNVEKYGESLHKSVTNDIKTWANKKGIQIQTGDKTEIKNRIKKMKLKRKLKKKQWLLRKKENQSTYNKMEVDLET